MKAVRHAAVDDQLERFKITLRHLADMRLFNDIDQVMDEAEHRAAVNPQRAVMYMQVAEAVIKFKIKSNQIAYHPLTDADNVLRYL